MLLELVIKEQIACSSFGVSPHPITKLSKQEAASDGMSSSLKNSSELCVSGLLEESSRSK